MSLKYSKELDLLKSKLQMVRKACLNATNKGDYMKVAKLTREAAEINKAIIGIAGPIWG